MDPKGTFTAFADQRRIAAGDLTEVALAAKHRLERGKVEAVLVFDDTTGEQIDLDLHGTDEQAIGRLAEHPLLVQPDEACTERKGPGRPKLGVVAREVTLLPRHWDWLAEQPGGASAALRRLVDEARRTGQGKQLLREATEAAGRFMWTMAGNLPHFEEASRALYAADHERLAQWMRAWPRDIRGHVERMVAEIERLRAPRSTA